MKSNCKVVYIHSGRPVSSCKNNDRSSDSQEVTVYRSQTRHVMAPEAISDAV
jgi:hypothetical protein